MTSPSRYPFARILTYLVAGASRLVKRKTGGRPYRTLGGRTCDEQQRRTRLLQALYRARVVEVAGDQGELIYSEALPPDWWVNEKLESMGEVWRVQNGDIRCW